MIRTAYYTKMNFEISDGRAKGLIVEFEELDLPVLFKVYVAGLYLQFERWGADHIYLAVTQPSGWVAPLPEICPIQRDPWQKDASRQAFLDKAAGEALRGDVGKQAEGSRPAIDSAPAGLRLDPKAVRQALEGLRHFPEEPPESSSSLGKDLGPDEQRSAYR